MADSILDSTKKILGLNSDYTPFDFDILTYINGTFSILDQLGIGPIGGFSIEDNVPTWDEYPVPANQLNLVRTYMFLKVRMLFDPPTTSFLIEATNNQIREHEWRLNSSREVIVQEAINAAEALEALEVLEEEGS